jgi:hypothetical protein
VVTPGFYQVTLVLMESWRTGVGTRVFDVAVQDELVFSDVDIVKEAGFQTPLLLSALADATGSGGLVSVVLSAHQGKEGPALCVNPPLLVYRGVCEHCSVLCRIIGLLFVMPALTLENDENDGGPTPVCKHRRVCEDCSVMCRLVAVE